MKGKSVSAGKLQSHKLHKILMGKLNSGVQIRCSRRVTSRPKKKLLRSLLGKRRLQRICVKKKRSKKQRIQEERRRFKGCKEDKFSIKLNAKKGKEEKGKGCSKRPQTQGDQPTVTVEDSQDIPINIDADRVPDLDREVHAPDAAATCHGRQIRLPTRFHG